MEQFLIIMGEWDGTIKIIHLTEEESIELGKNENDPENYLYTLEDKYDFSLNHCTWVITDEVNIIRYENGEEV